MKKVITLCAGLLISAILFAQAPEKMSYQAVIRNTSNTLLTNQTVGMRISILQGSPSGATVYVETQLPTSNTNGLVSLEIGSGTVVSGNMATIDWSMGPYFIKSETDPNGGTNYTITGTSQLLSVPYALYAKNAGSSIPGPQGPPGPAGSGGFLHYIGQQDSGGVIFHLWKDSLGFEHGLILDLNDLSTSQVWSNMDQSMIGSSAQSTWDGLNNSIAIINQVGHTNSAAEICLNSTNGGRSDWYLPSIQELNMLWNNYYTVARSLSQISGASELALAGYWSSTEMDHQYTWAFSFRYGSAFANGNDGLKSYPYHVRAVRAF